MSMPRLEFVDMLREVRDCMHLRVVEGLRESRVLKERREWLSVLDLADMLMDAYQDRGDGLLDNLPGNNESEVVRWMRSQNDGMRRALDQSAREVRSKRLWYMTLMDQWETAVLYVEEAVGRYFQVQRAVIKRTQQLSQKKPEDA